MNSRLIILIVSLYSLSAIAESKSHTADAHDHQSHGQSQVGMPMPASTATKTHKVTLTDAMRINFAQPLEIFQDDIIRFIVTNEGEIQHEFSVSSLSERKAHAEMMKKMPDMKHDDGQVLMLDPGETGELTWHFTGQPRVVFACNIPGHSEAGMIEMAMIKSARPDTESANDKSSMGSKEHDHSSHNH
jgi:uncharacterized cupredoxin-like copper-binding protein